ncbi:MAG: 6-phosphogluconolactonase [Thiohalomonadales bacterium]
MDKIISENSEQVIAQVSNAIIALAEQCIAKTGQFTIALSGGSTPKLLYQYLIQEKLFNTIELSKIFIYFSDERYVVHDDERSNYGLARDNLLNFLNIPTNNVFSVDTSFDNPVDSTKNYQDIIKNNVKSNNNIPEFDLILLGMGADGHTASLFPDSELVFVNDYLVGFCFHQESNTTRISFTFPLINAAKNVFIITIGKEKFPVLNNINKLEQQNIIKYPIQHVKPKGKLTWFSDLAAQQGD